MQAIFTDSGPHQGSTFIGTALPQSVRQLAALPFKGFSLIAIADDWVPPDDEAHSSHRVTGRLQLGKSGHLPSAACRRSFCCKRGYTRPSLDW
jgi:hypothetical protein